jgi:protein-S-isoprenylcysteine O-methyltransferase Ste14
MKLRHLIEIQKMSTLFVVLLMISIFDQWENPTAWVYLAIHGGYGFLWGLKGKFFPDRRWDIPASVTFMVIAVAALCLYWIAPFLLISRKVQAPHWLMAVCIIAFIFGLFLHFTADMQKFTLLRERGSHLIMDGLWSRTRNPNYLGELLIYLSFATLSMHWISYIVVLTWVIFYWLPKMREKDRSLSRYPEFYQYKKQSRLFIPFIF